MTQPAWTPEDQTLLIRTAIMCGISVAVSKTDSNRKTVDELAAIPRRLNEIVRKSSNPMLQPLASDAGANEIRSMVEQFAANPGALKLNDVKPFALRRCDELLEALGAKATPAQADEVKRAIIDVCQGVAAESKDGSFLGFGGVRISPEEEGVINEVRRVLKLA